VIPTENADVKVQDIADLSNQLMDILLHDRTTDRNIIWASNDYHYLGESYAATKQILPELIIGNNSKLIQPRTLKEQNNQTGRTRDKAEVFTPSWICNAQNNLIDDVWFDRKDVFNRQKGTKWEATSERINFPPYANRTWQKYVDAPRMEISCGEAPYIVSRYDATNGNIIPLHNRIGILDRKLRVVVENTDDVVEWFKWTVRAYQSVYAYEFQGDSLLLARRNMLFTFYDNIRFALHREPTFGELKVIANIISWNLWQMDGLTSTVPYSKSKQMINQLSFHDIGYNSGSAESQTEVMSSACRIKDWRSKMILEFSSLIKGTTK